MAFMFDTNAAHAFVEATFGYQFRDKAIITEALDTTGYGQRRESNQRLAMIGDSVMETIIVRDWFKTGAPKGIGSNLIQSIGNNENLAQVARDIGLGQHIRQNAGQYGTEPSERTLATTLEAVLGAIDLDSGEDASVVRDAMRRVGLVALTAAT